MARAPLFLRRVHGVFSGDRPLCELAGRCLVAGAGSYQGRGTVFRTGGPVSVQGGGGPGGPGCWDLPSSPPLPQVS